VIRGGLRTRLIGDSLRLAVIAGLEVLGWFDPTIYDQPPGLRQHQPLRYVPRPSKWDVPIAPNCLAISTEDILEDEFGLGDEVADSIRCYIDIFGEDDPVSWHLTQDIRDLLIGRIGATGRHGPVLDIYDLRMPTPAPFTQIDIEEVFVDRARNEAREYQNHWFMIRVDLLDEYADEFDATTASSAWNDSLVPAWQRIQAAEMVP
jgi:hypothetical protein